MTRRRRTIVVSFVAPAVVAATVLMSGGGALALPFTSAEVSGGSTAARTAASELRADWVAALVADGFSDPNPAVLSAAPGAAVSGVIATTAQGTTLAVERARYTASALAPEFVELSPNPGTATCTGSGLRMQGEAPRPSVIVGNSGCTNGNGTVWAMSGGTGEGTTRDAVEFTFSRPLAAFGAWFGDLETRTDGSGVPAIARVYGITGDLLEEWQIEPAGVDQSTCSNAANACGNNTTIWLGYAGDPITRMVVIVGDEDASGNALAEGLSFVGPSMVDAVPALDAVAGDPPAGALVAGASVPFVFDVSNPGDVPVQLALDAGCAEPTLLEPGATTTCVVTQSITQSDLNAGFVDVPFSVTGTWLGLAAVASTTASSPLVQSVVFTIALTADVAEVDELGDLIEFTAEVTNSGTVTAVATEVRINGELVVCLPTTPLAPGDTALCSRTVEVVAPEDVPGLATVTWSSGGSVAHDSNAIAVAWAGTSGPVNPPAPTDLPDAFEPFELPTLAVTGTATDFSSLLAGALALVAIGTGLCALRLLKRRRPGASLFVGTDERTAIR